MLSRSDKLKRKKINKFLSFIVICVTLSILILPAFTLEKKDDDTNDNNGPTTAQNINEQGGAETSKDSTLEPVINNNDEDYSSNSETNITTNESTDVVLEPVTNEDSVLTVTETIDDEYTVDDEEPVLLAEGATTTTTTGFNLNDHQEKITNLEISYKKDGNDVSASNGGAVNSPDDKYLKLKVDYGNIDKTILKNQYGKTVIYRLPDFFRAKNLGPSDVMNEITNEKIFTLEIRDGMAIVVYEDDFLNNDDKLSSYFFVEGEINLQQLDENGKTQIKYAGSGTRISVDLNYGTDYLEKYGDLTIKKEVSKPDKTNNLIKYEITVTAGIDGCGSVYVVDKFSQNGDKVTYKGFTKEDKVLSDMENSTDPFETRSDGVNPGKVYLTNVKEGVKIPPVLGTDETLSEPNIFVWTIGKMGANEVRKLTYYVELKDSTKLNRTGVGIKNEASSYASKDSSTYDKANVGTSFNANIQYDDTTMRKEVVNNEGKDYVKNADGTYSVKYRLNFTLKPESTFPLVDFEFLDDFNYDDHKTDEEALEYIEYKTDSIDVYKVLNGTSTNVKLNQSEYQILWSVNDGEYKTNISELSEKPTRFKVTGTSENPIIINPGDYYYLEYTIIVKPEAFAAISGSKFDLKNRFLFKASNAQDSNYGAADRVQGKIEINSGYIWNNKTVGERISTELNVPIIGDKYDLTSGNVQTNTETVTSFNVPEGSYKYTVLVNQTMGEWSVTNATMTDTITPSGHLKYVGYLKVDGCEYNSETKRYVVNETKWVKIDGRNAFSLKPSEIGFTDNNYSYSFEYYAIPYDLNTVTTETVRNTFLLEKAERNSTTFTFNNLNSYQEIIIDGLLSLTSSKDVWRYEDPKEADKGKAWENGKIYWIIKLSGDRITRGTIIKDATLCKENVGDSTDYVDNYLREDSVEGIFKGKFTSVEEFKNNYDSLENIKNLFDEKLEGHEDWYLDNSYRDLKLISKQDIDLTDGDLYIVVKTEPKELPNDPMYYRKPMKYINRVYRVGTDDKQDYLCESQTFIYYGGYILKELGQTFKYDGTVTPIDTVADKHNPTKRIISSLLNETGHGLYASWAFKLNHAGDMSGDYCAIENIPDGMELAYIRVKWQGAQAQNIKSVEINNLDSEWEMKVNDTIDDDNKSRHTIYYVNKSKRQAMIKLGTFAYNKVEDLNAVDIQVVCKVTDSKMLMGGENKTFNNTVELLTGDGQKLPADRRDPSTAIATAPFDHTKTSILDKTGVKDATNGKRINYTITANLYGQKLESNAADKNGLVLVDELDKNLELDVSTIDVKDSNGTKVDFKYNFDDVNNILKIKIPNEKKVLITYTAIAKIQPNVTANITNKVHWDGYSQNGGKINTISNYSYTVSAGGGASSTPVLSISKYDKDDNTIKLQGVEFKVWECKLDSGTISRINENPKETINTDEQGKVNVTLAYKKIYEIKETKPPTGYILEDKTYYVACVDSDYVDFVTQCNNYNANEANINKIAISYGSSNFNLQVLNTQKGIQVTKKFENAGGNPISKPISGEYRFGLFDNAEGTGTPIEIINIRYETSTTGTLTEKFKNPTGTGPYYVFELDDNNAPIKDSSVSKEAKTINKMEYLTSYETTNTGTVTNQAAIGDTVTVTNRVYTRQLPATGGNGINGYIKSGAMLMLLAGVLLLRRK